MLENAASDTHPDAEVIMATGHGAMDLAIMSLKYEAADFITKLINIDVLEAALRKVHEKILTQQQYYSKGGSSTSSSRRVNTRTIFLLVVDLKFW